MTNATRTFLMSLLTIAVLSSPATATADDDLPLTRSVFEENNVRYEAPLPLLQVEGASERQQEQVERATEMFESEGLELPSLVIRFSEDTGDCEGNLGTYRPQPEGDPAVVTVCTEMRITLIHELAHAWDDHRLHDERRNQFMDHWGLDNWNDKAKSWYDRGSERASDTIAYTLLHAEPTDNPDILKFVCGYGVLTGKDLPDTARTSCGGEVVVPAIGVS
jgi:hypothetical protein